VDKNKLVQLVMEGNRTAPLEMSAGTILFTEGEAGNEMFIVIKGEVRLSINNETLGTELDGGIVGEMALIDGSKRSATATAITDCQLVPLTEDDFMSLVSEQPAFALHVMRVLANRLRLANEILRYF